MGREKLIYLPRPLHVANPPASSLEVAAGQMYNRALKLTRSASHLLMRQKHDDHNYGHNISLSLADPAPWLELLSFFVSKLEAVCL